MQTKNRILSVVAMIFSVAAILGCQKAPSEATQKPPPSPKEQACRRGVEAIVGKDYNAAIMCFTEAIRLIRKMARITVTVLWRTGSRMTTRPLRTTRRLLRSTQTTPTHTTAAVNSTNFGLIKLPMYGYIGKAVADFTEAIRVDPNVASRTEIGATPTGRTATTRMQLRITPK